MRTKNVLTVAQAAEYLNVGTTTVNRMYHNGSFPTAYRTDPTNRRSHLKIPLEDLEAIKAMRDRELQASTVEST